MNREALREAHELLERRDAIATHVRRLQQERAGPKLVYDSAHYSIPVELPLFGDLLTVITTALVDHVADLDEQLAKLGVSKPEPVLEAAE